LATINTPTSQTDRTGQRDRQRSDSLGRTVLQTVAQKPYISLQHQCNRSKPDNEMGYQDLLKIHKTKDSDAIFWSS